MLRTWIKHLEGSSPHEEVALKKWNEIYINIDYSSASSTIFNTKRLRLISNSFSTNISIEKKNAIQQPQVNYLAFIVLNFWFVIKTTLLEFGADLRKMNEFFLIERFSYDLEMKPR